MAALLAAALGTVSAAGAAVADELGATGNERILWVYRLTHGPDDGRMLRLAYRLREQPGVVRFVSGARVVGLPAQSAVRLEYLHVFFAQGTHRRFAPRLRSMLGPSAPEHFTELSLPEAAVPLAVASDSAANVIYAVVRREVAMGLRPDRPEAMEPTTTAAQQGGVNAEPDPAIEPATTLPGPAFSSDLTIVRYERGRWFADRDAPGEIGADADIVALMARERVIHLLFRARAGAGEVFHTIGTVGEERPAVEWSAEQSVPRLGTDDVVAGGWSEGRPAVAAATHEGEAFSARALTFADGDWRAGPAIVSGSGESVRFRRTFALAWFDGNVAAAFLDESNEVNVGLWSPTTGRPAEAAQPVLPLSTRTPTVHPLMRQMVQYAVLGMVLLVVFVWRRDCVTFVASLAAGQTFARLSRRGLGLLIDLLLVAPVWAPGVYRLWRAGAPGLTPAQQLAYPPEGPGTLFWAWAWIGFVYGLYGTIFEAATATTAGKRIAGCFVVDETGGPCTVGAVIVRNLARAVEFHFLPLVLLVVLTPSRQRLGDILARTVVVERSAPGGSQGADLSGGSDEG